MVVNPYFQGARQRKKLEDRVRCTYERQSLYFQGRAAAHQG